MKTFISKSAVAILLVLAIFSSQSSVLAAQNVGASNTEATSVSAKSSAYLSRAAEFVYKKVTAPTVGSIGGEWAVLGLSRSGADVPDGFFDGYLRRAGDYLTEKKGILSTRKYTEYSRVILALTSLGVDARDFRGYDLTLPLGDYDATVKQGINGAVFALLALDSGDYPMPENPGAKVKATRSMYVDLILSRQNADGGWSVSPDESSDSDMTAMVLQALAKYVSREDVKAAVDAGVGYLSAVQRSDGGFESSGKSTCESVSQVIIALCGLGIPLDDADFVKNGKTPLDALKDFQNPDGGFLHTAELRSSNLMASEQALYTWVAVYRQRRHMRNLYDFRAEWSQTERKKIDNVIEQIRRLPAKPSQTQIQAAYDAYCSIPAQDRCYVSNYWKLESVRNHAPAESIPPQQGTVTSEKPSSSPGNRDSASASDSNSHANSHSNSNSNSNSGSADPAEKPGESTASTPSDNDEDPGVNSQPAAEPDEEAPLLYFSNSDRKEADSLPEKLTTKEYVAVTRLLYKLENSEQFDEKEAYLQKLTSAKSQIEAIQKEIDSINATILEKLYPFESISLGDKAAVDSIVDRYNALSEYDRTKIDHWEDVVKTKTKIDNLLRGIIIAVVLIVVAGGVAVFVVLHVRKRRRSKELAMEELAKQYADEDDES